MKNKLYKQALPLAVVGMLLSLGIGWAADADTASGTAALALQANAGRQDDIGSMLDDVRIRIGDVDVHPHLGTTFTYDDNITITRNNPQGDFYALVTPGVQLQYGKAENQISFDYTAGIERFFRFSQFDTVDHLAALTALFTPSEKLKLTVSQGFSRSMGGETRDQAGIPVGQIGERVPGSRSEVQNFTTALGAEYEISKKTAIGLIYSMSFTEYGSTPGVVGNLVGSDTYDVKVPFYYHLSQKTDIFIDGNAGITTMGQGQNQNYEGFGVGARTRLTGKINGQVRLGYQHRDYDGGLSSVNTVVATANADWAITPRTTLIGSINRSVNPSAAMVNNYYESTAVDLAVHQKLWHDKITFSAGGGYERDDYGEPFAVFTGSGASANRSDDYYYLKAGCDYAIRKWWGVGVSYRFRSSVSNLSSYDFDNNMGSIYTRVSF